jgi:DNA uptake protein ComE-like DNA-binding protein
MYKIVSKEAKQLRILISIPLIVGILWSLSAGDHIFPDQAVSAGEALIVIQSLDETDSEAIKVLQPGNPQPNRLNINSATFAELVLCPGIGSKTAHKILLERKYRKFADWRDLHDRVHGVSRGKVEKLKEAGIRLTP